MPGPMDKADTVREYLARAAQARKAADGAGTQQLKDQFLKVAYEWERMADKIREWSEKG